MGVALVAGMGLALGCSRPSPPTLVPERVTLTRIDAKGFEVDLELDATNPNRGDIVVSGVTSRIVLERTQELGGVQLPRAITLPAGATTKIDAPISVDWTHVGALAELAATGAPIPYSVDGTLDLGGALLHVGVPFHLDGVISQDDIVRAALRSIPAPIPGGPR